VEDESIFVMSKDFIIGCDEVGYGSLAGPLVVCGVRASKDWYLEGLNDSKKLSAKRREAMQAKLGLLIKNKEIRFAMVERSNVEIDKLGVAKALKDAYDEVFDNLYDDQTFIIVDGVLEFTNAILKGYEIQNLIKADSKIPAVMAASIIAKVYRDSKMKVFHILHPMYGWDSNVGYGSTKHIRAIDEFGPSPLHRMSYAPMKNSF
jgi:ribonuclease HII